MIQWSKQTRTIKELKPNPKNPRRLFTEGFQKLKDSIEKFGTCQPIVINKDNTILGGHQRYLAYKELKTKEVAVMVPDKKLDEKKAEELAIRLNRAAGEWDYDVLANEFELEDLLEWGFELDEFGMEKPEKPEEEEKKKKYIFKAIFESEDQMQYAVDELIAIVTKKGGSYKI